jgi:hypothetical protein
MDRADYLIRGRKTLIINAFCAEYVRTCVDAGFPVKNVTVAGAFKNGSAPAGAGSKNDGAGIGQLRGIGKLLTIGVVCVVLLGMV